MSTPREIIEALGDDREDAEKFDFSMLGGAAVGRAQHARPFLAKEAACLTRHAGRRLVAIQKHWAMYGK